MPSRDSVLFVTLDSCRYDAFVDAAAPALKAVGPLHRAQAPSHFTYGSHAAMFVGFTPTLPQLAQPVLNAKYGKLFKLVGAGFPSKGGEGYQLSGRSIVAGFGALGFRTLGTAAMGWFDPGVPTGQHLTQDFERFFYAGRTGLHRQLAWVEAELAGAGEGDVFAFLNVGETHVPYWHEGADWDPEDNPCIPFQTADRAADCRRRQVGCIEYADRLLAPLLARFSGSTVLVCGDHGDCWGEDGLWEHGTSHPATLTVPLLVRVRGEPVAEDASLAVAPAPRDGAPAQPARRGWAALRRALRAHTH